MSLRFLIPFILPRKWVDIKDRFHRIPQLTKPKLNYQVSRITLTICGSLWVCVLIPPHFRMKLSLLMLENRYFFVDVTLNSILSISVVKCSKNWSFDLFRKIHLVLLLSSELLLSTMRYSHFCSRASAAFEHQHYCTTYTVCAQRLRMDSQLSFESHPKQI